LSFDDFLIVVTLIVILAIIVLIGLTWYIDP